RHLLDGDAVRAHHRRPDDLRDLLTQRISFLRSLHESADDVLLGGDAAEEVALRGGFRLVVEDWRVTGVGDKDRQVLSLWQVPGERRRGIQDDEHRARLQVLLDRTGDLTDRSVRYGQ